MTQLSSNYFTKLQAAYSKIPKTAKRIMYKEQKLRWTINNKIYSKLLKTASETQRCSDIFVTFLMGRAQLNKGNLFYRVEHK